MKYLKYLNESNDFTIDKDGFTFIGKMIPGMVFFNNECGPLIDNLVSKIGSSPFQPIPIDDQFINFIKKAYKGQFKVNNIAKKWIDISTLNTTKLQIDNNEIEYMSVDIEYNGQMTTIFIYPCKDEYMIVNFGMPSHNAYLCDMHMDGWDNLLNSNLGISTIRPEVIKKARDIWNSL